MVEIYIFEGNLISTRQIRQYKTRWVFTINFFEVPSKITRNIASGVLLQYRVHQGKKTRKIRSKGGPIRKSTFSLKKKLSAKRHTGDMEIVHV